jgi:hypothetical protein
MAGYDFWDFIEAVSNEWRGFGIQQGYQPDVTIDRNNIYFGYRNYHNGRNGRVNYNTHYHVWFQGGVAHYQRTCGRDDHSDLGDFNNRYTAREWAQYFRDNLPWCYNRGNRGGSRKKDNRTHTKRSRKYKRLSSRTRTIKRRVN